MSKVKVTLPHLYSPRWYQKEIWEASDTYNRIFLVAHRRSGKDYTCFNILVTKCIQEVCIGWYILPTREQARKVIWDAITNDGVKFLDCIPKELISRIDSTTKVIYLINGSTIWLLGADADSLVGANPKHIVFSEYALYSSDPWPLLQPIITANGGSVIFNTTPRGTNHAYVTYNMALNNPKWKVINHSVEHTKLFTAEQLEEILKDTTRDLFDQEYLVKFLDGSSQVFKNIERIIQKDNTHNKNFPTSKKLYEIIPYEKYHIGLDIAKVADYTVLTAVNLHTFPFRVYPQVSFNQIDYPLQQAKIETFWEKYNQSPILMDDTGGGKVFIDSLSRTIHNIEGYTFTESSRSELLTNLAIKIEQQMITIPDDEQLIMQLKGFHWVMSATGKQRMISSLKHDDCFIKGTKILTNQGQKSIEDIEPGDMVMTRDGYKKVINTLSSIKKVIHNPLLNLTGTPNHPIITKNGQVNLVNVSESDILYIWNEKQLCIMESNIIDTLNLEENTCEITSGAIQHIKDLHNHFIGKYIGIITVKSLKVFIYTTLIQILLITRLKTYKHLVLKIIIESHKAIRLLKKGIGKTGLSKQKELRGLFQSGKKTTLKSLKSYVGKTVKAVKKMVIIWRTGKINNPKKSGYVQSVVQILRLKLIRIKYTVQMVVGEMFTIKDNENSLKKKDLQERENSKEYVNVVQQDSWHLHQRQDSAQLSVIKEHYDIVYNIHVEDKHEYFANNILVHNCVMSLALSLMHLPARPRTYKNDQVESEVKLFDANIYRRQSGRNRFRT